MLSFLCGMVRNILVKMVTPMSAQARFEKYAMTESLFTTSGIGFIDIQLKLKKHKNDFNW